MSFIKVWRIIRDFLFSKANKEFLIFLFFHISIFLSNLFDNSLSSCKGIFSALKSNY